MNEEFYQFVNQNVKNAKVIDQYIYQHAQQIDLYTVFVTGLQQKKFSEDAIFIALVYLKNRLRMYNIQQNNVQEFLQLVCELMQTRSVLQLKMLSQLLNICLRNIRLEQQEELFTYLTNCFESDTFCLDAQIYLIYSFSISFNTVVHKNDPIYEKMILFVCEKLSTDNQQQQITLLKTLENIFQPICPQVIYHKYLQDIIAQLAQVGLSQSTIRVNIIQIFVKIMQSFLKLSNSTKDFKQQYGVDQNKECNLAKQILDVAIIGLQDNFDENFFIHATDIIFLGITNQQLKNSIYNDEMKQNIYDSIINTITNLIKSQLLQYEVVLESISMQETELQPILSAVWCLQLQTDVDDVNCMNKAFRLLAQLSYQGRDNVFNQIQCWFTELEQIITNAVALTCTQNNYEQIIVTYTKLYTCSSLITQQILNIPQNEKQQLIPLQLRFLNIVTELLQSSSQISPCVMWHLYQVLARMIVTNQPQLQGQIINILPRFMTQIGASRTQTELFELTELCIKMIQMYMSAVYQQEDIPDRQIVQVQEATECLVKNFLSLNPSFSLYSNLLATLNAAMQLIKLVNNNFFNQLFLGLFDNISIEQFSFTQLIDILILCSECLDEDSQISQQMFDKIVYVCWFLINSISCEHNQISFNQVQSILASIDDTINKLFSNSYISQLQYNCQLFEIYQRVVSISKIQSNAILNSVLKMLLNIPDYCKTMQNFEIYNYIYTEYKNIIEANNSQQNKDLQLDLAFMIALSYLDNPELVQEIYLNFNGIFCQHFNVEQSIIEIPIIAGGILMHVLNQFIFNQNFIQDLVQNNDLYNICITIIEFAGLCFSANQVKGDFLKAVRQRVNKSYEIFIQLAHQHTIYNEISQKLNALIDIIEQMIAFKHFNSYESEENLIEKAQILKQYGIIDFQYVHVFRCISDIEMCYEQQINFLSVRQ